MRSEKYGGYFTLEAAFLVPMAVFLFVFVIHLTFYMSGRTWLAQDAYTLAFRASLLPEEEDAAARASQWFSEQTKNRYTGNARPEVTVTAGEKAVHVRIKTRTRRRAFDLAGGAAWDAEESAAAMRVNVTKRIRRIDRIADLAALLVNGKENGNNHGIDISQRSDP